jgi:hypothetical protein
MKRKAETIKIGEFIATLIESAKTLERNLLLELDSLIIIQRKKLQEVAKQNKLQPEINEFKASVEYLNQGIACVYNMTNIEDYI